MKLLPLKQAQQTLITAVQRRHDTKVTLLTWKRDRSVSIVIQGGTIHLREDGYENRDITLSSCTDSLKRELKDACAREFPRSHQVYVQISKI
ncbi:hypothetical protein RQN30_08755 [Arcanobacterium hippocoleae]